MRSQRGCPLPGARVALARPGGFLHQGQDQARDLDVRIDAGGFEAPVGLVEQREAARQRRRPTCGGPGPARRRGSAGDMPTREAISRRGAPAPSSSLARQICRSWRSSMNWMRSGGSRLRSRLPSSARAARVWPAPIALVSSKMPRSRLSGTTASTCAAVTGAPAPAYSATCSSTGARRPELGAGGLGQGAGGVGLEPQPAAPGLGRQPVGQLPVAQGGEVVQVAAPCAGPRRTSADRRPCPAHQDQAGRGVGIGDVGQQRRQLVGLAARRWPRTITRRRLANIGSVRAAVQRRAQPAAPSDRRRPG